MTPGARVSAAAGVLDRVLAGEAAEAALTRWARESRFAGSADRAAVRDLVYDALRRRRSLAARLGGEASVTGRGLMIGLAVEAGRDLGALFDGVGHAPAPLSAVEVALAGTARPEPPEAVRLDVQDWQLPLFRQTLGDRTEAVLGLMRQRAPAFARANLGLCDRDAAVHRLAADGIGAEPHPLARTAIQLLDGASRLRASGAFLDGWVELQDAAGQAACAMLPFRDGAKILDYCAGGGGKTLAIGALAAAQGIALTIVAHDANPARMADLTPRAARARLAACRPAVRVEAVATQSLTARGPFDLVLVDAPCSGSGTWARTPDAKWRLTEAGLADYVARQAEILGRAARLVGPGGVLAYMTCSLFADENAGQVAAFTARHADWRVLQDRQFDLGEGGDGFYVAMLTRSPD